MLQKNCRNEESVGKVTKFPFQTTQQLLPLKLEIEIYQKQEGKNMKHKKNNPISPLTKQTVASCRAHFHAADKRILFT